MRGYRNSNGGVPRRSNGSVQTADGRPCCCGEQGCGNFTGCSDAKFLCTGRRFILPHVDSVSVSGSGEIDQDSASNAYHRNTGGTIAGNSVQSAHAPVHLFEYTISVAAVDHSAFKSPDSDVTIYGYKIVASLNGESMTFDGTTGTGVTVTSNITTLTTANGTWATGPEVVGSITNNITNYQFSSDIGATFDEFEAVYFSLRRYFDSDTDKFGWELDYMIERRERTKYKWSRVWLLQSDIVSTSPAYSITQYRETSSASGGYRSAGMSVRGKAVGISASAVSTPCTGTTSTFTASNVLDRFSADESDLLLPSPDNLAWELPNLSSVSVTDDPTATGTPASGSVTMAIDTGAWTEQEVGCRDCPRYLTFTGTMDVDFTGSGLEASEVTATISGRLVLLGVQGVGECEWYQCVWTTDPASATATVTFSDATTASAGVNLTRLGPSLWRLRVDTSYGGSAKTAIFYLSFAGQCPIGAATVAQRVRTLNYTLEEPVTIQAIHRYGDRAVSDGMGGVTISSYDEWTTGDGYISNTADTTDVSGDPIADLDDGYTSRITASTFSFSEDDRDPDDPSYYCNGYVVWDTGEELDADSKDIHWRKKIDSGSYFAPTLETSNFLQGFYYNGDNSGPGKWLGTDASGTGSVGVHTYETYLIADGTPESDITCYISADNYVTALEINGTVRATNLTPNDTTSHEQEWEVTISAAWLVEGRNTIRFAHEDQGVVEGFRCRWVTP